MFAETLEAATEAAALLSPRYDAEPARIGLDSADSFIPSTIGVGSRVAPVGGRRHAAEIRYVDAQAKKHVVRDLFAPVVEHHLALASGDELATRFIREYTHGHLP